MQPLCLHTIYLVLREVGLIIWNGSCSPEHEVFYRKKWALLEGASSSESISSFRPNLGQMYFFRNPNLSSVLPPLTNPKLNPTPRGMLNCTFPLDICRGGTETQGIWRRYSFHVFLIILFWLWSGVPPPPRGRSLTETPRCGCRIFRFFMETSRGVSLYIFDRPTPPKTIFEFPKRRNCYCLRHHLIFF